MTDRPLSITSAASAASHTSDLKVTGDGDLFALQFKITSANPKRMFSAKFCKRANLWQFSFLDVNTSTGLKSCAEASVAVPYLEDLQRVADSVNCGEYPITIDDGMLVNDVTQEVASSQITTATSVLVMRCVSRASSQHLGFEKATYYVPAVSAREDSVKGIWLMVTRERNNGTGEWSVAASASWVDFGKCYQAEL